MEFLSNEIMSNIIRWFTLKSSRSFSLAFQCWCLGRSGIRHCTHLSSSAFTQHLELVAHLLQPHHHCRIGLHAFDLALIGRDDGRHRKAVANRSFD